MLDDKPLPNKPDWWPKCPYPESIFPMSVDAYPKIVPDPQTRTALSGALGRLWWNMASDEVFRRYLEEIEENNIFDVSITDTQGTVKEIIGAQARLVGAGLAFERLAMSARQHANNPTLMVVDKELYYKLAEILAIRPELKARLATLLAPEEEAVYK